MQRNVLSFNAQSLQTPSIDTRTSFPQLLDSVSKRASQFADESIRIWQQSKVEEAQTEGQLAGSIPGVQFKKGDSLTTKAFNQAARESALSSLNKSTTAKMNMLQNKYYNNPDAYLKESSALISGATEVLKDNKETAIAAAPFEQAMLLNQQTQGYTIAKKYNQEFIEKKKIEIDDNLMATKVETYRTASGIFSEDPQEKAMALNIYHQQGKMFEGYAHQTTPDGKAVFSATDIDNMKKDFNQGFFVKATQDYVTSNTISEREIVDILDGNITMELPDNQGGFVQVDVGIQMGEANIQKVKRFTEGKLREQAALEEKRRAEAKRLAAEQQKQIASDMAYQIATGEPITFDMIDEKLNNGIITSTTALNARNQIIDYNDQDDVVALSILNNSLAEGIDIDERIAAYSNQLKSSTIISLRKANAKALADGKESLSSNYRKMLSDEFGEKDMFGFLADQKMVPVWNDLSMEFNRRIDEGEDPNAVFELLRPAAVRAREAAEEGTYQKIRDYVVKDKGKIGILQSATELDKALDAGKISFEDYEAGMNMILRSK